MSLFKFFFKFVARQWLFKVTLVSCLSLFMCNIFEGYHKPIMTDYLMAGFDYVPFGMAVIPSFLIMAALVDQTLDNEMSILLCRSRSVLAKKMIARVVFCAAFFASYFSVVTFGISAFCSKNPNQWFNGDQVETVSAVSVLLRTVLILFLFFAFYGVLFCTVNAITNKVAAVILLCALPLVDFGLTLYWGNHVFLLSFLIPPGSYVFLDNGSMVSSVVLLVICFLAAVVLYLCCVWKQEFGLKQGGRI